MILCIGVLCVAVLVPVVGRKKVSSEVRRAAVVMILVSALAILAQISEEMESGGIELELVRPSYGEGDYEEEMTVDAEGILDGYSYQVVVPERILSKQEEQKLLEAAQQEIDDEFVKFAKRSGGDFPQIIRTTAARISAKIEVEREVDTVIAGKKLEGKIMSVMPFFILAYLNLASGEFIDPLYGNLAGVLVMSAALLVFVGAMAINRRISDIRV